MYWLVKRGEGKVRIRQDLLMFYREETGPGKHWAFRNPGGSYPAVRLVTVRTESPHEPQNAYETPVFNEPPHGSETIKLHKQDVEKEVISSKEQPDFFIRHDADKAGSVKTLASDLEETQVKNELSGKSPAVLRWGFPKAETEKTGNRQEKNVKPGKKATEHH